MTWRSLIPGMPRRKKDAKAFAVRMARAAGYDLRGPRGAVWDDYAEAFCISLAAGRWWYDRGYLEAEALAGRGRGQGRGRGGAG